MKKGADPNYLFKSYGGVSAFHIAVGLDDNIEFTKLFLDYKADAKIKWLIIYIILVSSMNLN